MSDLISRLSLKDRVSEYALSSDEYERFCKIIDAEPTSYDIGKVVDELEKLKDKGSVTKTEMLITKSCVDKAIEIIKQGGVSDDVCECRLFKGHQFLHETSCGNTFDMGYGFKYCPYCGKKIKVVE